jgi:hypothetical protein
MYREELDKQIQLDREFKITENTMTKTEKRLNRQEMQVFKSIEKEDAIRNLSFTPIAPRSTLISPKKSRNEDNL